ncbi:hypothetical protein DMA11_10405 [Marinilabiliaceae bacterium JC017]|nr:hypothetical protein DMA11_10405 [Marinilabiliaceae bacterium JC017]
MNSNGQITSISNVNIEKYQHQINGTEPFSLDNYFDWRKDLITGEWIYLPDITPVDKTIIEVNYNWQENKCYITIADQFRPGPYEFDCLHTWTDADCQAAIDNKFNNQ